MTAPRDDIAAWVQEHGPQLVLFARQWVQDMADAEDVVQEAFVSFWPRKGRAHQPIAYLYQCVRNSAQNWARSRQRRRKHEAQANRTPWFESNVSQLEIRETGELIEAVLETLPIEQREVVVMHIWGNLTFREIAAALETPLPTAQSRYRYAMRRLRSQLEKVHNDE